MGTWSDRKRAVRMMCGSNCGGGKRDRTADLLHAMQALSQLSYTPHGQHEIIRPSLWSCNLDGAVGRTT